MSINPNHLPQTSHTYKLINGAVPSNMKHVPDGASKFEVELKRWYVTNKKKKLDRQLSYFDNSHCTVGHYCAPVNIGNYHWVFLDVVLRNKEFRNGCVGIIDLLFETYDQ